MRSKTMLNNEKRSKQMFQIAAYSLQRQTNMAVSRILWATIDP